MKTPLIELLRPISFHRSFVTLTGSINASLMLSQALYWSRITNDPDGWFYKSAEDWEAELGITWEQQNLARKKLREAGVWEEKRESINSPIYYRVNVGVLETRIREGLTVQSGKPGVRSPGSPESAVSGTLNPIKGAETTTEITTETTQRLQDNVKSVFAYWQEKTKHPGAILDAKRKAALTRAMKLGYTAEQLRSAVDGCLKSAWHQGDNPDGKTYDAITLISRDAEHIEKFIGYSKSPPKARQNTPVINGVRVPPEMYDEQTGWISPEFGRSQEQIG